MENVKRETKLNIHAVKNGKKNEHYEKELEAARSACEKNKGWELEEKEGGFTISRPTSVELYASLEELKKGATEKDFKRVNAQRVIDNMDSDRSEMAALVLQKKVTGHALIKKALESGKFKDLEAIKKALDLV